MGKYMKYEIKGSYKFILGIIVVLLLASTIIQYNIFTASRDANRVYYTPDTSGFRAITLTISILVIFGSFLAAFFHIVGSFKKELYEDRGYLTFTLPLTGNKILGAKLLVGALWYAAITITIVVYNFLLATIFHGSMWIQGIRRIVSLVEPSTISSVIISSIIVSLLSLFLTLVLVYLSMALSKVSVKNKKIGGLWFVIFLVLSGFSSFLTAKISAAFPYYINMANFKILHFYDIYPAKGVASDIGEIFVYGNNFNGYINIFGNLAGLMLIVLGFLATGYLIEKKIDL